MGRFVGRRLVAAVFLLLGITLVTFVLTNVVPGDPAAVPPRLRPPAKATRVSRPGRPREPAARPAHRRRPPVQCLRLPAETINTPSKALPLSPC